MTYMKHFEFDTLLADSRALVSVSCEIDIEYDNIEFSGVFYEGTNVTDILSDNQWADLEAEALKAFKAEQEEQLTIDHDL